MRRARAAGPPPPGETVRAGAGGRKRTPRGGRGRGASLGAPGTTGKNAPQILGRAGIAPEIAERPAFEKLGSDLATIHLAAPSWVRDRLWSRCTIMKSRI